MKEKELKILILIFVGILVLAAIFIFLRPYFQINVSFNPERKPLPKIEAQLVSTKSLYQNNEKITLAAKIKSDNPVENLTVHIYGLKDKKDRYLLDQTRNVNLSVGQDDSIQFVYRLPNCFSCAGLSSGPYQIKLEVIKNNSVLDAATAEINLVSVQ